MDHETCGAWVVEFDRNYDFYEEFVRETYIE